MASALRRALLYVPASSPRFLEKSRALAVDLCVYDLEDSVSASKKPQARTNVRELLSQPKPTGIREQAVRINSVESGLALDDLNEVLHGPNLDSIVIPKVHSASDLRFVTDVIRKTLPSRHPSDPSRSSTPPIQLLGLVESARAVMNLSEICRASPYLSGLIFAAEDFALDLSLTRTPGLTEFLYARSALVTACRAYNLPSVIDLVCTDYKDTSGQERLASECENGKSMGFNGKQCIHPSQVDVCQSTFSPSDEEVEWAVRIVIANEKADRQGRGAWTLDGKMIDAPVVGKAKAIVSRAEKCGIEIDRMMKMWAEEEPK